MKFLVLCSCAMMVAGCAEVAFPNMTNGQGEIAGEATTTSVILQSRLTVGSNLVEGDHSVDRRQSRAVPWRGRDRKSVV